MSPLRYFRKRNNNIYYFLGNIHQHIIHALPLYNKIGGTFIVTSQESYEYCIARGVRAIVLDDRPDLYLQYDDTEVERTIDYINQNAKVVLFYEVFSVIESMTAPYKIMLNHGNSFKDYFIKWRRKPTLAFDYYAALGPVWEQKVLSLGYPPERMLKVGLARWDKIIKSAGHVSQRKKLNKILDLNPDKPAIAYMPTWWGPTSVYDIGKDILRYIPSDYEVIFRPHPDTPPELIKDIQGLIRLRNNIYYVPEDGRNKIDLTTIYAACELFIGDMSSVTLDAMLLNKPMIFAFGNGKHAQDEAVYEPVKEIYQSSAHVNADNVMKIDGMLKESFQKSIDIQAWRMSQERVFYGLDANNVRTLKKFICKLVDSPKPQ